MKRFLSGSTPIYLALLAVLLLAGWLRWQFITTVQLYPDEFVTLLAVQMIGQKGVPIMPSGLFYEHGLLYSFLASLADAFGPAVTAARGLSLLLGLLTLLLTFWLGRRWISGPVGLLAATGLAVAPAAIHWSGRARMYSLLQPLVLLTLWLAFEGFWRDNPRLRWLSLLAFLAATLAHFGAVALAPPLVVAALLLVALRQRGQPGSLFKQLLRYWPEAVGLAFILLLAFLIKRLGQPRGIEQMEAGATAAVSGIGQVLAIYGDLSLNGWAGWQAVSPFYAALPALLFVPFALLAAGAALWQVARRGAADAAGWAWPTLFLSAILLLTTLEMVLLVSPHRRDDKYLFMLLPVLLLLGATGAALLAGWLWQAIGRRPSPAAATMAALLASVLVVGAAWPSVQRLLANTGDDYAAAFDIVRGQWQPGDAILTGTPAAAIFYLGRSDFYSVQKSGGYDYRILTVGGRAVDRWLASPAIRTAAELHQTLANNRVWLVLERWGLQREYYDLPFQQQLLAQTDLVADAQGMFVLRSKANPQPIALQPAQPLTADFNGQVRLLGYTAEPAQGKAGQPLRLTLYWQAAAPLPHNYTVFVHLRQPGGGNVAQADHLPLGSIFPTSLWPVGETIRETSDLPLPPDLAPGEYELWAGLYLLETGERLPVTHDASGENAVMLGRLQVANSE